MFTVHASEPRPPRFGRLSSLTPWVIGFATAGAFLAGAVSTVVTHWPPVCTPSYFSGFEWIGAAAWRVAATTAAVVSAVTTGVAGRAPDSVTERRWAMFCGVAAIAAAVQEMRSISHVTDGFFDPACSTAIGPGAWLLIGAAVVSIGAAMAGNWFERREQFH